MLASLRSEEGQQNYTLYRRRNGGRDQTALLLFSHSVVANSLLPHELQHTRLSCPSSTPGAWSNTCPLSPWCYPTISSSFTPFSSCPQSFPVSGSFPTTQPITSGGQSIRASASVSVLPINIQDWFSLGLTGLTSLSIDMQINSVLWKDNSSHIQKKVSFAWICNSFQFFWSINISTILLFL